MKRVVSLLLAVLLLAGLLLVLAGCGSGHAKRDIGPTFSITDSLGRTVEVPEQPQSICCADPFCGSLLVMFGAGSKMTTTVNNARRSVLLTEMCPSVADAVIIKSEGSVNAESILKADTDLVFVGKDTWKTDVEQKKLLSLDVPVVVVDYSTVEKQQEAIRVVGRALGQEAAEEAGAYADWYADTMEKVGLQCSSIPETEQIHLYHAVNEAARTDSAGSIGAAWIAQTGVTNVSLDRNSSLQINGDKAYTTLEKIYTWDPDIIISNETGVADYILTDPKWQGLRCVQEGKVYQIPVGVSRMGHPTSTETPLALLWLANLLYPEEFPMDFNQVLKDYYQKWYDYTITDEEAEAIRTGKDMRTPKNGAGLENAA